MALEFSSDGLASAILNNPHMEQQQESTTLNETVSLVPPATGSSQINLSTAERVVSTLGGAALTLIGIRKLNSISGISLLLGGGFLLSRGISGYCAVTNFMQRTSGTKNASAMEVECSVSIESPRSTVYAFWRKLENLPQFMKHLDSVSEIDDRKSRWTAKLPGNVGRVSWEAEITEDISGELISWNSLPGSSVDNAGTVRFKDSGNGQGTELQVRISYRLPGGDIGSIAAKLFSPAVEKMMIDDVKSFKQLMESGKGPSYSDSRTSHSPTSSNRMTEDKVFGNS
jgi:uncharacterized membrane protein